MIDLGGTFEQIRNTMNDLYEVKCNIMTIGQYFQPSKEYLPVTKYYKLEEYENLKTCYISWNFKI